MALAFRKLKADEIDCYTRNVTEKSVKILLYKDARCDMTLLDELVGPLNWKREHTRDNHNCVVSIYDEDKHEWVSKEDVGTPSDFEADKGLASDSFKRACTNWGIGRELYTAPEITIWRTDKTGDPNWELYQGKNGKCTTFTKFRVAKITYNRNGEIDGLCIVANLKGKEKVVFVQQPKDKEGIDPSVVDSPIPQLKYSKEIGEILNYYGAEL